MTQKIVCDYSVAKLSINNLDVVGAQHLKSFCVAEKTGLNTEFLFVVLPDAAMPEAHGNNIFVPVNYDSQTISWIIIDEIDGKSLQFQIGSISNPLDITIANQIETTGYVFTIFINARSGAPKGIRIFKNKI